SCGEYLSDSGSTFRYGNSRTHLRLYLEGTNFRRIGRLLEVAPQTVINWVNAYHAALYAQEQTPPQPDTVETAELDDSGDACEKEPVL
ncbi:MAG: helix-turn-helix domain-containing protein, partial [Chthonomonadaceae bacterium]|nr:helix-turn-helix domain-containing protein [Chthonomonadaceae bacterium]